MLKKHSQLFENLLLISDLVLISLSWVVAYYFRFFTAYVEVTKGVPDIKAYLLMLAPIMLIWGFAFKAFGLYRPKRIGTHLSEVFDITKACIVSALILIAITFYLRQYHFSRLVFVFFTMLNIFALSIERLVFREALRFIRKKGYNLRYSLVVGTGEPAAALIERLEKHPEVGIKLEGVICTVAEDVGRSIAGVRILDVHENIRRIIEERRIDTVFVALQWQEHAKVVEVLKHIGDEAVDIKVVPDILEFITLRGGVEEFDGIPLLNLQNSPLYGWNLILKRVADIAFASVSLAFAAPVMLIIGVVIKLSSKGSVLYRQERMGIGGDTFVMLKFRSMRTDAEERTGAVWAQPEDPRRTRFGAFLRKTSLDELPQLFNVIRGDMSIVGPRPERPVFIQEFRKNIPKYMLRHKMKAGIPGWAQVNGWRGNTDVTKRIEHDIYYIENWSIIFDIKILWLTLWKGLINRNAY